MIMRVFDGHNDVLLKLRKAGGRPALKLFHQGRDGHIDLLRAVAGGFAGGFFAIFVPSPMDLATMKAEMAQPEYDLALPDPIPHEQALPVVMEMVALLMQLEAEGALRICRSVAEIRAAMAEGEIAAVMHIEGAEAIDPAFHALDVLYAAGLRSLGPVWSRSTVFGHGVPFKYPSTGDIGPGLTRDGKRLVARCDEIGIVIDLSHLNEAGFWDVAGISSKPLIATHSNAHALCPQARNLTDAQLDAVGASGGMVGLNFATGFLRPDGQMVPQAPVELMLDHLDHMIERMGEDHVGLGSDFDGAVVPEGIKDASGLPVLIEAMRGRGYSEEKITKLAHENWLRVLGVIWGG
ncbi:dipeptidase [Alisedimentitalea sp. MJ-SS2]|uniref:dipeptidase n=1 Tax=Aliisedimentitalea sp. MJ-SS2 TaxID=3049795 RepID=UPI00290FBF42|nr:dipeptidase [Alisedimentitalea sp. MJ-SS2]MDU8927306.1 dipeptidase [Alisedimentitalea sp. MJ-SS2]